MWPEHYEMHLKANLKSILKEKGMSVTHLSKQSGVAVQTLHNWLTGLEPRNLSHVKRVADYLGISIDELCFKNKPTLGTASIEEFKDEINCGVFEVVLRKVKK